MNEDNTIHNPVRSEVTDECQEWGRWRSSDFWSQWGIKEKRNKIQYETKSLTWVEQTYTALQYKLKNHIFICFKCTKHTLPNHTHWYIKCNI